MSSIPVILVLFFLSIGTATTIPPGPGALLHLEETVNEGSGASKYSSGASLQKSINQLIFFSFKNVLLDCNVIWDIRSRCIYAPTMVNFYCRKQVKELLS